ncbi:hypothetical protein IMSAG049_00473 [Clostridiales bacterium]|nr:hypothetical protein IMSAG049_00473 [Clostridiales bacterium]
MKRFTAMLLAAVMSLSMAASASAASFSDINDVPWEGAKEYINSVADAGLMVGDTNSSGNKVFRAKDRITYNEAMQLAYSVLKGTESLKVSEDKTDKWKSTMQAAYIPEWAYTAVAYGLESGVVSANDIKIFMKSEGVNRDATRENVAVIFGKALSHISEANPSAELTFKDKSEITASSVPYIDLLARLNILVGDESGNFKPKNYINRAEMAVITSKSYNKVKELKKTEKPEEPKQPTVPTIANVTGVVTLTDKGTSENTITIAEQGSNSVKTFKINSSTPVISIKGDSKAYTDIKAGDNVTITTSNNSVVSIILNETDEEEDKVLEGYLNNISDKVVTFDTEDGKQERYEITSDTEITFNGGRVDTDDLYEYVIDRNILFVKVTLDNAGKVKTLSAKFYDVEGELTAVKDGNAHIKFEIGGTSKTVKLTIASDCDIYIDGKESSESKAEKLFDDKDRGTLLAKAEVDEFNKVEKLDIFHDKYSSGELVNISSSDIEIKSSFGKTIEYDLDEDAELELNGIEADYKEIKSALKSSDLLVTLEFNKNNEVTKLSAQAKEASGQLKAADDKRIVIVDSEGGRMTLELDRDMECVFNGDEVNYSKFQRLFHDAENKVMASAELNDKGEVVKIEAKEGSGSEGTVVSISSTEIVIEDIAGDEHKYKIEPAMQGYLNDEPLRPASKIIDYAREDDAEVRVTFSSRGYVNRIYVTLDD